MKDRALWNEAARTDSFSLTLDEFLAFRHPGLYKSSMGSLTHCIHSLRVDLSRCLLMLHILSSRLHTILAQQKRVRPIC